MENEEKNTPEKNPNNFHNKDQKDLNFSHKSYCGLTNQGIYFRKFRHYLLFEFSFTKLIYDTSISC